MIRKALGTIFGLALAFTLMIAVPNVRASMGNEATQLTFSQPFQIPGGAVLPAGTYWFKVVNEPGLSPNYVRILNVDRTDVLATLQTIPTIRTNRIGHSEVTFAKFSADQPPVLLDWYAPSHMTGHEFIYSPATEARISESKQFSATVHNAPLVQIG